MCASVSWWTYGSIEKGINVIRLFWYEVNAVAGLSGPEFDRVCR